MKKAFLFINLIIAQTVYAEGTAPVQDLKQDVHLFQNFLNDSPIAKSPYIEAAAGYSDYDNANAFDLGVHGGFQINNKIEILGAVGFVNLDPDGNAKSESGLTDFTVLGKYQIQSGTTQISAGGFITLPTGKDELGEGNTDFGGFASLRHPVSDSVVLSGEIGLDFIEVNKGNGKDREASFNVGGGAVIAVNSAMHVVTEAVIKTETDEFMLSGGVDYALKDKSRVRAAIGLGLDDGSADFALNVGYLINF